MIKPNCSNEGSTHAAVQRWKRRGRRSRRALRQVLLAAMALATVLTGVTVASSPALAVSSWSGKDPYHDYGNGFCANDSVFLDETALYDGATLVGYGYLRYSRSCQTNWSEFWYANNAVWGDHTVEPWAWEQGKTGTDQYSRNLDDYGPVYSLMVDGRGPACAGAHLYAYPSHQWISWHTFGCA